MDENLQAFNVSDNAARKISALLKDEQEADGKYMRVAVEGGGCSGFQYIFKFDSIKNSDDLIFKKNDVSVVIDEISLELIKGGTLDYTEELIGSYFQVINPNASSACGCGTSFSI
jgi:iron-sulfur cluster insertion protein|tara:strand:- start:920 stop:1264 length:345 start_codon:yes stop_codon:yes gene_type:complete